jgi:hypothetical protein
MRRFGLLVVLSLFSLPARAYELKHTNYGSVVRFDRAHVRVVVDRHMENTRRAMVLEALVPALEAWSQSGEIYLDLDADGEPVEGETIHITWPLDQWPYGQDELAITQLEIDSRQGRILSATIRMNDNYRFSTLEGERAGDYAHDLQGTLTHELGHAIGLSHSEETGATMYPGAAPRETRKRTLDEDDRAGLNALYYGVPMAPEEMEEAFGCSNIYVGGGGATPFFVLIVFAALLHARQERRTAPVRLRHRAARDATVPR